VSAARTERAAIGGMDRESPGFLLGLLSFVALNALVAHLRSDCGLSRCSSCATPASTTSAARDFHCSSTSVAATPTVGSSPPLAMAIDINSGVALGFVGALIVNRFRKPTLPHLTN